MACRTRGSSFRSENFVISVQSLRHRAARVKGRDFRAPRRLPAGCGRFALAQNTPKVNRPSEGGPKGRRRPSWGERAAPWAWVCGWVFRCGYYGYNFRQGTWGGTLPATAAQERHHPEPGQEQSPSGGHGHGRHVETDRPEMVAGSRRTCEHVHRDQVRPRAEVERAEAVLPSGKRCVEVHARVRGRSHRGRGGPERGAVIEDFELVPGKEPIHEGEDGIGRQGEAEAPSGRGSHVAIGKAGPS